MALSCPFCEHMAVGGRHAAQERREFAGHIVLAHFDRAPPGLTAEGLARWGEASVGEVVP